MWQYDAATDRWAQLEPASGCPTDFAPPTGRVEHALEYDPINRLYWVFGGSGSGCNGPARGAGAGTTKLAIVDPTLPATTVNFYKDWTVAIFEANGVPVTTYVSGYNPASGTLTLASPLAGAAPGSRYYLYPQRDGGTFSYSPVTRTWSSLTGPHWGYTGHQPSNRLSPAMAYSTRATAIVMFGGQGRNDTWALDAETKRWVPMIPNGAPGSPPGLSQLTNSMVYDSDNDVFILFGGCLCTGDGGPSSGDTWAYRVSTNTWTRTTPAGSPPARQGHNLVYDSANKTVVLFGGFDAPTGTYYNDLWVYRYASNTWTQVFPAISPPGRRTGAMAYDPVRRLTVLYAGKNRGSLDDVWTLQLQGPATSTSNPAPSLTSLSPTSVTAGGPAFTITVTGANFASSSVVRWNGASRATTYVRSTQLQASIPAPDIASIGTAQVSVVTPGPGGGASNPLSVTVTAPAPAPTLTSISPATAAAGGPAFTLTATGANFVGKSVVRVNGSPRATTFVSATKLTAAILAGDVATAGTPSITVLTPAPGGGTSASRTLTVSGPSLALSAVTVPAGGSITVTLTNGPGGSTDWLGLGAVGTADVGSNVRWTYVGAGVTTRTWTVNVPATTGQYEFRLFLNDGYVRAATSPAFAVAALNPTPSSTSPSPDPAAGGSSTQTPPPVGTWAQLSGTAVYPAQPFEAKSESAPSGTPELWSPRGLFAYSGGDVCQLPGGSMWGFLLKGGGHGDSPDMSFYWVPFDGSGAKRLTGPYLAPDKAYYYDSPWETYRSTSRNQDPTTPPGQVGKARHTYSSLVCAPEIGLAFMVGGSITSGSGGGTNATRTYDLTQTAAQAMARPDMGWALNAPAPRSAVASASGWDPVRRRFVTRSSNFIGAYDPATNTWEIWNPPSAPYGSDFQASVAMDVAGRKMYVLGDRLAEVLDLDTKAYTDLRGKPWAARFVTGPYLPGPGVSWHAGTKQIVAWTGGQNLLLIDPVTDVAKTVAMGGVTVSAADGTGTYGRFRVIPGTNQVVLVNLVNENVLIGTVPFDGGSPVPAQPRRPLLPPTVCRQPTWIALVRLVS